MTIWQIDQQISDLVNAVDPETGEALFDVKAIEALQMERDAKVENLALAVKNMTAEAKAIRDEENALAERRKSIEAKADRAKKYLDAVCGGEAFKSAKCAVTYRKSKALELDEKFLGWAIKQAPGLLRERLPEPDKAVIKHAIEQGVYVPYCELVERQNIQIK